MKNFKLFLSFFIVLLFSNSSIKGQVSELLLSKSKFKNALEVYMEFSKNSMLSFSQFRDSIIETRKKLNDIIIREGNENLSYYSKCDTYPNYSLLLTINEDIELVMLKHLLKDKLYSTMTNLDQNFTFSREAINIFEALYHLEKGNSKELLNIILDYNFNYHEFYSKYIYPNMFFKNDTLLSLAVDLKILDNSYFYKVDRYLDNQGNLTIIKLTNDLWNKYQLLNSKIEMEKDRKLQFIVKNESKADTIPFYSDKTQFSPERNKLKEFVMRTLLNKFIKIAEDLENLKELKNGYTMKMDDFMKLNIENSGSPYQNAMHLTQNLIRISKEYSFEKLNLNHIYWEKLGMTKECNDVQSISKDILDFYCEKSYMDSLKKLNIIDILIFDNSEMYKFHEKFCKNNLDEINNNLIDRIKVLNNYDQAFSLLKNKIYLTLNISDSLQEDINFSLLRRKIRAKSFDPFSSQDYSYYNLGKKNKKIIDDELRELKLNNILSEKNDSILFEKSLNLIGDLNETNLDSFYFFQKKLLNLLKTQESKLDFLNTSIYNANCNECEDKLIKIYNKVLGNIESISFNFSETDKNKIKLNTLFAYSKLLNDIDDYSTFFKNVEKNLPESFQNKRNLMDLDSFLIADFKSSDDILSYYLLNVQNSIKENLNDDLESSLELFLKSVYCIIKFQKNLSYEDVYPVLYKLKDRFNEKPEVFPLYNGLIEIQRKFASNYNADDPKTYKYKYSKRKMIELRDEFKSKFKDSKRFDYFYVDSKSFLGIEYSNVVATGSAFQVLAEVEDIDTIHLEIEKDLTYNIDYDSSTIEKKIKWTGYSYQNVLDTIKLHKWRPKEITNLIYVYQNKDYNRNKIELIIPALETGSYTLKFANSKSNNAIVQKFKINVSPVWMMGRKLSPKPWKEINNDNKYDKLNFLVNRKTGEPLKNFELECSESTDNSGFKKTSRIEVSDSRKGVITNFESKIDYVILDGKKISLNLNYADKAVLLKKDNIFCDFFTDRAVYRAGQTIHAKIIFWGRFDSLVRPLNHDEILELNGKIQMLDFRGNEILSYNLGYGYTEDASITYDFNLNESILNGEYVLQVIGLNDSVSFSQKKEILIESYKRSTYEVQFDLSSQLYNLGDTICLSGKVKALAGYPIESANVNFELDLTLSAPYDEITLDEVVNKYGDENIVVKPSLVNLKKGNFLTDVVGNFNYCFQTGEVSYHTANMLYKYVFKAVVSDSKGEIVEAVHEVKISKDKYAINIDCPEKMDISSIPKINISIKDINNRATKADFVVRVHKVKSNPYFTSYRLWKNPSDTIISASEQFKISPYLPHWRDEHKIELENLVRIDTFLSLDEIDYELPKSLSEAKYNIEVEIIEKDSSVTKRSSLFSVIDWNSEKLSWPEACYVYSPKNIYIKSEQTEIYLASSSPDTAHMLVYVSRLDSIIYLEWHKVFGKKKISISNKDLPFGEFEYHVYMVKENRFYEHNGKFTIKSEQKPKKLKIEYEFSDNFKPRKSTVYEPNDQVEIRFKVYDKQNKRINFNYEDNVDKENFFYSFSGTIYDAALERFKKHELKFSDHNGILQYPSLKMLNRFDLSSNEQLEVNKSSSYDIVDVIDYYDPGSNESEKEIRYAAKSKNLNDLLNKKPKESSNKNKKKNSDNIRKDFDETIYWDQLIGTSSVVDGDIVAITNMNDALTKWNGFFALCMSDGSYGECSLSLNSNKPFLVQANKPRFVRERDSLVISSILVNQIDKNLSGEIHLEIINEDGVDITGSFITRNIKQKFNLNKNSSKPFEWKIVVPDSASNFKFRIYAKSGKIKDIVEETLPVHSGNNMEIEQKNIKIDPLREDTIILKDHVGANFKPCKLNLNINYNQSWNVLQSLPYLLLNSYDCTEQLINKIYSNALSKHILDKNPEIVNTLKIWQEDGKYFDEADDILKLKMQNPWIVDLLNPRYSKFYLANSLLNFSDKGIYAKIIERKTSNGGLSWYGEKYPSVYISNYTLQVMGRYKKITGKDLLENNLTANITRPTFNFLTNIYTKQFTTWKNIAALTNADITSLGIREEHLNYMYTSSFYPELKNKSNLELDTFMYNLLEKQWQNFKSPFSLAHIAIIFNNFKNKTLANTVLDSLLKKSFTDKEGGRYWLQDDGYYWYEAPIEIQSLMIETFNEIRPEDTVIIDEMKTWLLMRREGMSWKTTKATSAAAFALMLGKNWLYQNNLPNVYFNNSDVQFSDNETKLKTGKIDLSWTSEVQNNTNEINIKIKNNNQIPTYATSMLYTSKPLSEIKAKGDSTFSLRKKYFSYQKGIWIELNNEAEINLKRNDKVKTIIELVVQKPLEFVHLIDYYPSGFEPANTSSGMIYNDIYYYKDVRDGLTNYFISTLPVGKHFFEFEYFVNNKGSYQSGLSTVECMYAPKFKAIEKSTAIKVKD